MDALSLRLKNVALPAAPSETAPTTSTSAQKTTLVAPEAVVRELVSGVYEALRSAFRRREPTNEMLDLKTLLTPAEQAQVDPKVFAFYKNPTNYDLRSGVDMTFLGKGLLPLLAHLAEQGNMPDQKPGFENNEMKQELTKDRDGSVHWHRQVKYNGEWHTLFDAKFEREGRFIKETFRRGPLEIPLYFEVEPYEGGIRLTLDKKRSSPLVAAGNITFTTVPTEDGLLTKGHMSAAVLGPMGDLTIRIREKEATAA